MRIDLPACVVAMMLAMPSSTAFAADPEIKLMQAEVAALRADYEYRIAALEQRLMIAEQNVALATQGTAATPPAATSVAVGASGQSVFNPAIGVIFQGQAWNRSDNSGSDSIQGFPLGGEAGPIDEGLGISETELIMNANVDDKFSASLTAAFALEDGEAAVEIEEAWIETTALPAGFGARFGRFFSGIGYLNDKHAHSWDFVDQPLPYKAFLANQYTDTGVQLRWLAPTDLYLELGSELMQGGRYPAAGNANSGFGSVSVFAKIGGDFGVNSSWLAGVSYLDTEAIDRVSGDENDPFVFNGKTNLTSAEFVWKWAPNGNWKERNFVLQSEYFLQSEDGEYAGAGLTPSAYNVDQRGWYIQAVYQPRPRWRLGGRLDGLSSDDPGAAFAGTLLASPGSEPRRFSLMADWSNSEFSRVRLQLTKDDSSFLSSNEWGIQYTHSIGAHGAHAF